MKQFIIIIAALLMTAFLCGCDRSDGNNVTTDRDRDTSVFSAVDSDTAEQGDDTSVTSTGFITETAADAQPVTFESNGVYAERDGSGRIALFGKGDIRLTDFIYDNAELSGRSYIILTVDGKKTLFDTSFNGSGEYFGLLFDRTYDDIEIPEQYPYGALLILTDGGRKYPSSYNGRTEPDIDCSEYRISEGLLWAVSSGKKTGLYSAELEEIYPQQADELTVFHSGLNNGTGSYINGALIFFVKKDGKLACFTNYAGSTKQRSEFIYDSIEITTLGRSLAARRGGRPYGICSDGNEKGLDYDVIYKNSGISVIKYDLPLGCGMIDKDDNTVIPFEYAGITATDEGTFLCSGIKGEDGVIFDEKGQLISEGFRFVYRLSAPDGKNTRYICEKDMKHVLIDAYGNKISIGPEYSDIEYGENDTYVLITETGNVTVDKNGSILG